MNDKNPVTETVAVSAIALFLTALCFLWLWGLQRSIDRTLPHKSPPPPHATE